jgi:hypothetical protein
VSLSPLFLSLLLAVAGDAVKNGDVPPPPPPPPPPALPANPDDLRAAICQRPSLAPLVELVKRIPPRDNPDIFVVLRLDYEADGAVTGAKLERTTEIPELDAALVEWAGKVRLCPGARAGQGRLAFSISLD